MASKRERRMELLLMQLLPHILKMYMRKDLKPGAAKLLEFFIEKIIRALEHDHDDPVH